MLTVQVCLQHRQVEMHTNEANSFPVATVLGEPPPRKTWDPKRREYKCSEVTREYANVSTLVKSSRGGSALSGTSEQSRQ